MARKTTTKTPSATKAKPRRSAPGKAKSTVSELAPMPKVKQRKSVFSTGTLITVLLLVAMIELTVYLKGKKEEKVLAELTPVSEVATIFNASDGIVSSIEIKPTEDNANLQHIKIARNAANAWAMILPIETEADQGMAEAAASQVSALQVISQIDNAKSPSIFGLDIPAFTITIEYKGGKQHTLEVGDATPTNSGYYVRVDKNKMIITDLSGIQSLLQLVISPPYLNTPTPPTLTPVPATEAPQVPTPTP